jgi:hypothetical protein
LTCRSLSNGISSKTRWQLLLRSYPMS